MYWERVIFHSYLPAIDQLNSDVTMNWDNYLSVVKLLPAFSQSRQLKVMLILMNKLREVKDFSSQSFPSDTLQGKSSE